MKSGLRRLIACFSAEAQILPLSPRSDTSASKVSDRHLDRLALARFQLFLAMLFLIGRALDRRLRFLRVAFGGRALAFAHQVVIKDEFIAVGDQQVGGRLLDADADYLLGVLAQLGDQRREIGVAADDDEGIDVRFGVAEVERIHDQADVGRVLARLAHMRDLDQLEIGLMHRRLECLVAIPVAISFLDDDAALEQEALEYRLDVEFFIFCVAHAERDVFEVAEYRHADVFVG